MNIDTQIKQFPKNFIKIIWMHLFNDTHNQSKYPINDSIQPIISQKYPQASLKSDSSNQLNEFSTQNTLKNQNYSNLSNIYEIESDNINTFPLDIKPSHIDQLYYSQKFFKSQGKTIRKCTCCKSSYNCLSCKGVCIFDDNYFSRKNNVIEKETLNKKYHKQFCGDIKLLTFKSKSQKATRNQENKEYYRLDQEKLCSKPEIPGNNEANQQKNEKKSIKKKKKILNWKPCMKTISKKACKKNLIKLIEKHENEGKDLTQYYNEMTLLGYGYQDLTQYHIEDLGMISDATEEEEEEEEIEIKNKENIHYDDNDEDMIANLPSNKALQTQLGNLILKHKGLNLHDLFTKFKNQRSHNRSAYKKLKEKRLKEKKEADFYKNEMNRLCNIRNSDSIELMDNFLRELDSQDIHMVDKIHKMLKHKTRLCASTSKVIRHCAINENHYVIGFYKHGKSEREDRLRHKKKLIPHKEIKFQIDDYT